MKLIECCDDRQKELIYELYMEAFPENERKPFELMVEKCRQGMMEMLVIEGEEGQFAGLAIMILYKDIALLDYFAISPSMRGQQIGSGVLALLKERYAGRRLLIEIEDVEEEADNTGERIRRKAFYLRNGMCEMPYRVWLFGVKMQIFTSGGDVDYEAYHEIFGQVFSEWAANNVKKA